MRLHAREEQNRVQIFGFGCYRRIGCLKGSLSPENQIFLKSNLADVHDFRLVLGKNARRKY